MTKLAPFALARLLLLTFAAAVLAYSLAGADAFDVVVLSLMFLPWIIGPAAIAALLVARSRSKAEAWLFLAAQIGVIVSTAWLWVRLYLYPDAQNGIAMIFFPIVQFAAVLAYFVLVVLARALWRHTGFGAR